MILPPFYVWLSSAAAASSGDGRSSASSVSELSDVSISTSSAASPSASAAGSSKSKCNAYTLKYKREVIAAVDQMRKADSSISISAAISTFGLPHFYYNRWKKTCTWLRQPA
jgi:hypothetical protein